MKAVRAVGHYVFVRSHGYSLFEFVALGFAISAAGDHQYLAWAFFCAVACVSALIRDARK